MRRFLFICFLLSSLFKGSAANFSRINSFELSVPVITPDGPTTFCAGESVTLTSSSLTGNIWSPNGETTQSIIITVSGNYYVTVTDSLGNTEVSSSIDVTVNENPETPLITASGSLSFCEGDSVILTSSVAEGYLWSSGGETTQSITVTSSGMYAVTIYHVNGCRGNSDTLDIIVSSNPAPVITIDGSATFCEGDSTVLSVSAYETYLWLPSGETTQNITVYSTGNFSVTVTDSNGCSGISGALDIETLPLPLVNINPNGIINFCEGDSVRLIASSPNASGYQWFRNGINMPGTTGVSITVIDFANYSVEATAQNGCSAASQIVSVQVGQIPYAYAGIDEIICEGDSISITAANGGQNFLWSNGATTQSINASPSDTTEYTVTVSNPYCTQTDIDSIIINVTSHPVAEASASGNFTTGSSINFSTISGDNSIVTWFWDLGDGNSESMSETNHTYDSEGIYLVTLTVENQYGCVSSDTIEVNIQQVIDISNVITPNGDGINDYLSLKNNGVENYRIRIFNRNGQVVYEQKAKELNWDGRTNSGVLLSAGTYFYILKIKNNGSLGNIEQTGYITVIR